MATFRLFLLWLSLFTSFSLPAQYTDTAEVGMDKKTVLELRQYKIAKHKRDELITLFEKEFIESQEKHGMRLIGQFRDLEDPDRFVWLRQFENMSHRAKALQNFYSGPVWQQHRDSANPLLVDNDNVLLLHNALPKQEMFTNLVVRQPVADLVPAVGHVVITIHYLWKDPQEGYTEFFYARLKPELEKAGLPVMAMLVRARVENNFPRLPVRESEKVFVWFTRTDSQQTYQTALQRLNDSRYWPELSAQLADFEERSRQVLQLTPTTRSALR